MLPRPHPRLLTALAGLGVAALTTAATQPAPAAATGALMVGLDRSPNTGEPHTLTSHATVVVMLREGTRTVLSFQSDYAGPAEDFALVVPVPTAVQPSDVHTLHPSVFEAVERAAGPRVVALWERDPCPTPPTPVGSASPTSMMGAEVGQPFTARDDLVPVRVQSQFQAGEYDISMVEASDASGLEAWLRAQHLAVTERASAALRPYVEAGMQFFVARVNVARLAALSPEHAAGLQQGRVMLSALRFHVDSERFVLPMRLGLANSAGEQDLTVHILSPEGRYAAANYRNRFAPTNQPLTLGLGVDLSRTYERLFARLSRTSPRTVFTEYAGAITPRRADPSCLGCERAGVSPAVLDALGAGELPGHMRWTSEPGQARYAHFVLTRLHYRYAPSGLPQDLELELAPPVAGGYDDATQARALSVPARASLNDFGVRFISKQRWADRVSCDAPRRHQWGTSPRGSEPAPPPRSLAGNMSQRSASEATTSAGAGAAHATWPCRAAPSPRPRRGAGGSAARPGGPALRRSGRRR